RAIYPRLVRTGRDEGRIRVPPRHPTNGPGEPRAREEQACDARARDRRRDRSRQDDDRYDEARIGPRGGRNRRGLRALHAGGMSGPIPRSCEAVPCAMRHVMGLRIAVVGGAAAGRVLANRTRAHADYEIMLLDAGRTYYCELF